MWPFFFYGRTKLRTIKKIKELNVNRYQKFFWAYTIYIGLYDILCVKNDLKLLTLSIAILSIIYIYYYCRESDYGIYLYFFILTNMYAISRAINDHASINVLALMSLNTILLIIHYIMEKRSNDIKGNITFISILAFQIYFLLKVIF